MWFLLHSTILPTYKRVEISHVRDITKELTTTLSEYVLVSVPSWKGRMHKKHMNVLPPARPEPYVFSNQRK